jgi:folylpolyglutamate synthase/dihydropteroate synthase
MRDKNWPAICRIPAPGAARVLTAPVQSERSANPHDLSTACLAANRTAEVIACLSLAEALDRALGDPFVVVTGSLHFVGHAMEMLGVLPTIDADERGLNEWSTPDRP